MSKMTKAQRDLLSELSKRPSYVGEKYQPLQRLLALGFVAPLLTGSHTYEATPAGLRALSDADGGADG